MFGIPGKGEIKVVEIGLAKGNDMHGVVREQRLILHLPASELRFTHKFFLL